MAFLHSSFPLLSLLIALPLFINPSYGFYPKLLNASLEASETDWSPAGATWYGSANGAGSDGNEDAYMLIYTLFHLLNT